MDIVAWLTSTTGLLVVGILFLLIGYGYLFQGAKVKTKGLLRMLGFVLAFFGVMGMLGIQIFATDEAPAASTVGSFEVTATESSSWLSIDQNAKKVVVAMAFDISDDDFTGNTEYVEVTFTVQRGLGTVGLVQTYGDVSSIPSVSSDTGDSYPIILKNDDLYEADWEREDASTANKMVTLTIAEDDDGVEAILNITLNSDAVAEMDAYDSEDITVTIGGQTWTIQCLLATKAA
jgi:hypothetical protein